MKERMLKMQAPIPESLHHQLRIEAAQRNVSLWELIRMVLWNWKKAIG